MYILKKDKYIVIDPEVINDSLKLGPIKFGDKIGVIIKLTPILADSIITITRANCTDMIFSSSGKLAILPMDQVDEDIIYNNEREYIELEIENSPVIYDDSSILVGDIKLEIF